MNVGQMHIAIQQGVDKINSLQADMLLPQEIDIELNKSMRRFINLKYGKNNKYGQGFEQSQKRIDDLRILLEEVELLASFKEQLSNKFYIDTVVLPDDYMYLINQRSTVQINNCNPITFSLQGNSDLNYFKFSLDFATKNNTGFINSLVMRTDPNDFTTANYLNQTIWEIPAGLEFPQDIEAFRLSVIEPDNHAPGIQIFWEEFGTLESTGDFIVTVDKNMYPQFNWDSSITNTYTSSSEITVLQAVDSLNTVETRLVLENGVYVAEELTVEGLYASNVVSESRTATSITEKLKVENKFVQQDDIFTLLNDPFNTTKYTNPLTTIRSNNIDIYTNDIFIIESVKILYLREPIEISLSLGDDCELPNHTHQEIVDMTVNSILEGISDPRYRSQTTEVGKNE
tara:strand:- start:391 stop:1590 length:1200 start_codon:yes stop_codon:yes gene_type:complete